MQPRDLLKVADDLVHSAGRGRPSQAHLRRAVSATYYALFHDLAQTAANLLIGGQKAHISEGAWKEVYRALEHGTARGKFENKTLMERFPQELQDFADRFNDLQKKRNSADYDPYENFSKSAVHQDIRLAERVIENFKAVPKRDQRAFAAYSIIKNRKTR